MDDGRPTFSVHLPVWFGRTMDDSLQTVAQAASSHSIPGATRRVAGDSPESAPWEGAQSPSSPASSAVIEGGKNAGHQAIATYSAITLSESHSSNGRRQIISSSVTGSSMIVCRLRFTR